MSSAPTRRKLRMKCYAAAQAQDGKCVWCGDEMLTIEEAIRQKMTAIDFMRHPLRLTAEHLQPRSLGGRSTRENIAAACLWCNSRRPKMSMDGPPPKKRLTPA